MGNALVHNDGLTMADMSAVESFSVGTYGDGTYEDQTQTDSATNNSKSHRLSYDGKQQRRGHNKHNHRGDYYTQTGTYADESTTGSKTSSTRLHHGYQPRNFHETRDDRNEYRKDYKEDDLDAYRNDPRAYIHDRLQEYEQSRHATYQPQQKNVTEEYSKNTYREAHSKLMSKNEARPDDELTVEKDTTTIGDIFPAETDMAYADSQDGSEAPVPSPTNNVKQKKQQSHQNHHLPSTASDVLGSLARLEEEQQKIQQQLTDNQSLQSDSFSTLTKTIDTQTKQRMKDAMFVNNPNNKKLEELLYQQQLQEEKLQRQLEQLRLQKERLQQLHGNSLNYSKQHTVIYNLAEREEKERNERLAKARENCMSLSPKSTTPALQEHTPKANASDDFEPQIIHLEDVVYSDIVVVDDFESIENKYINAEAEDNEEEEEEEDDESSATGEGDTLAPAFEDVPTHCSVDPEAAYHGLDAIETLSVTATQLDTMGTERLDFMSTLTSIKDEDEEDEEVQNNDDDDDYEEEKEAEFQEEKVQDFHEGSEQGIETPKEEQNNKEGNEDDITIDSALQEILSSMDDDIDLEFVANYDEAFNAFLETFSDKFDPESDFIQNLKVAKLQKILEASYQAEADLEAYLESANEAKTNLEADFQQKLKDASRHKAARTIELQSELKKLKRKNRSIEGKLTWDLLSAAIKRASHLQTLETSLEKQVKEVSNREDLIKFVPDQPLMQDLRTALKVEPKSEFPPEQQQRLQTLQVDNALLKSEAKVLEQKIAYQRQLVKKQAWIDELLLKLDSKKLDQLKTRYKKKLGLPITNQTK